MQAFVVLKKTDTPQRYSVEALDSGWPIGEDHWVRGRRLQVWIQGQPEWIFVGSTESHFSFISNSKVSEDLSLPNLDKDFNCSSWFISSLLSQQFPVPKMQPVHQPRCCRFRTCNRKTSIITCRSEHCWSTLGTSESGPSNVTMENRNRGTLSVYVSI